MRARQLYGFSISSMVEQLKWWRILFYIEFEVGPWSPDFVSQFSPFSPRVQVAHLPGPESRASSQSRCLCYMGEYLFRSRIPMKLACNGVELSLVRVFTSTPRTMFEQHAGDLGPPRFRRYIQWGEVVNGTRIYVYTMLKQQSGSTG
jgi:hypothetical protein